MIVSIYELKRLFLDEFKKLPSVDDFKYSFINVSSSNYLTHYSQENVIFHKFYNFKNLKFREREYGHFYRFVNRLVIYSNLYFLSRMGSLEDSNRASVSLYELLHAFVEDRIFQVVYFDNNIFKILVEMKCDFSSDVIFDYKVHGSTSSSTFCSFVSISTTFEVTERYG